MQIVLLPLTWLCTIQAHSPIPRLFLDFQYYCRIIFPCRLYCTVPSYEVHVLSLPRLSTRLPWNLLCYVGIQLYLRVSQFLASIGNVLQWSGYLWFITLLICNTGNRTNQKRCEHLLHIKRRRVAPMWDLVNVLITGINVPISGGPLSEVLLYTNSFKTFYLSVYSFSDTSFSYLNYVHCW